ncbi:LexA family transcriptional regulator [Snodgrassella communis]|uniref:LexA family transcriptional regulator n=1 Tax=Snodgrassella communis TaxID=2946699 RepID=UPI00286A40A9|nr:S24 family peptidase [Snodgrassella communis]WMY91905.1 S24 family peptidase [Snodgrassella communis]
MNTLRERLQELMSKHGLVTQQDLADFANVSKGLVNQWFNGETGLGKKPLIEFEKKTNFSFQWLAEGSGNKYKSGTNNEIVGKTTLSNTTILKQYDMRASCGFGSCNPDFPELLRTIEIPNNALVELLGTQNLNSVELMPPDGDSMEPTIPRRSITLIKTDIDKFQDSGVYLITFDGYTYIKRLARGKSGVIKVMSDNKRYADSDFDIKPDELDLLIIHGKFWKALPLDFIDI